MFETFLCGVLVVAGSLLLGQAVLRLCGTREWSWVSAPVGLSAMMLVTVPALHLPGRSDTVAAILLLLCLAAAAAAAVRDPGMRPPPLDLLAALPVALLVTVPFLSVGYSGTLGVSLNNDMGFHLAQAEAYRDSGVLDSIEVAPEYPLGPHSLVAALAQGLGMSVDHAFAGLTAAIPVLLGLTALAALSPGVRWIAKLVIATVVGLPFLVAGYYGQGSFKEIMQVLLVVGFTLELRRYRRDRGPLRWIPLLLIGAGTLSVYSFLGLGWPIAIACVWLAGLALPALLRRDLRRSALAAVRSEASAMLVAAGVTLVLLVPQLPRLFRFFDATAAVNATGIETTSLGNLAGPIPFWEAFGIWASADYRIGPPDPYTAGAWAVLVLVVAVAGAVWWVRRGDWLVPAAAAATIAIWIVSEGTQSPYVTAKALVIVSPLVLLTALRPLVEQRWEPGTPRWWVIAAPLVAAVIVFKAVDSSWGSLRFSPVGPRDHLTELRSLRPLLGDDQTLFLGNSDFIKWELAGVRVTAPIIGIPWLPIQPDKAWEYGMAHDIDSVDADTLNTFRWVITTRDPAGSAMPPQLRHVRSTASFALWERTAEVPPRETLQEGEAPAAKLDCSTAEGRAIRRAGGEAGVRLGPVGAEVRPIPPGGSATVPLELAAGTWELALNYGSAVALEVTAPGLRTTLPPNMDRPGPRFSAGSIELDRPQTVEVTLRADDGMFRPDRAVAYPGTLIAVPRFGERTVPVERACGELVDWYRPAAG